MPPHIGDPVVWTDRQTDGHMTITSLPKFLHLIGYQICLAMVLRWCVRSALHYYEYTEVERQNTFFYLSQRHEGTKVQGLIPSIQSSSNLWDKLQEPKVGPQAQCFLQKLVVHTQGEATARSPQIPSSVPTFKLPMKYGMILGVILGSFKSMD